jgi:hypothetical protein
MEENTITTVEGVIDFVLSTLTDCDKQTVMDTVDEKDISRFHHTWGRQLRNTLGCWQSNSNTSRIFRNELGVFHPDDMSGIIMTSIHRKLHNKPLDLETQAQYYKDYWANQDKEDQGE